MKLFSPVVIMLLGLAALVFHQSVFGQAAVTGRVTSQTGQPIVGAKVFYHRKVMYAYAPPGSAGHRSKLLPVGSPVDGTVNTGPDGRFTLPPIPDGNYTVCAASSRPGFVPQCRWAAPTPFTVSQGRAATLPDIRLAPGVEIHIRVNDPSQLAASVKNRPEPLIVGVLTNSNELHMAEVVSQDAAGHDRSITVPSATPLKLWLFSRTLKVTDNTDKSIDVKGYRLPFQAAANINRIDYLFKVTGVQ
jgi:hypothetical protein